MQSQNRALHYSASRGKKLKKTLKPFSRPVINVFKGKLDKVWQGPLLMDYCAISPQQHRMVGSPKAAHGKI